MARRTLMQRFAKWHIWLGWLVGVPMLLWTVSGLVMAARPIEDVRGEALLAQTAPIATHGLVFPADKIGPVTSLALVQQVDGPAWIVTEPGGGRYRYSARDGSLIPPVIASEAQRIAENAWAGEAELASITYFPADLSPTDLRGGFDVWQAHFADGTNLYMRADTGEIVATRTGWWRIYDFMWGLHIMDLQTREDTSHPVLIVFAALGVLGSLLGCALLFRRRKARVKGS
ncbi:MAG: PepSY domain-containing protein [Alteraurantiacibacter sp.]